MQKNIVIAALGVFILALIFWPQRPVDTVAVSGAKGVAAIGGPFTLVDTSGHVVHDTDFYGKPLLVYMGYTRCPDICPATLTMMKSALQIMGLNSSRVTMVFVTLDPEHDTPQVLGQYLSQFDPRIVGLTGTKPQIDAMVKAYKAYYANAGSPGNVTIDHSGLLYLMDAKGHYIRHFESGVQADTVVTALGYMPPAGTVPAAAR